MSRFKTLMSTLLGDTAKPDTARPSTAVPRLVHWLPYRSYDPKTQIFFNSASRGFVLEVSPMIGVSEAQADILTQFISEGIPTPGMLQFHGWMSPRVSEKLSQWYLPRYAAAGVYERMAKHRTEHLLGGVWESLSAAAPFCLRNHRLAISYSTPESSRVSNDEISAVMEGMISTLESIGVHARAMDPKGLITWIDDITSPTTAPGDDTITYNPFDPIADQAVRHDLEIQIEPDRLLLRTERFRPTGKTVNDAPEIGEIYPDTFGSTTLLASTQPEKCGENV